MRKRLLAALMGVVLFMPMAQAQGNDSTFCWQQSYTRTPSGASNQCPSGSTFEAGLCYPECPSGYTGIGPVCWQNCPSGFTDIGVSCQKPKDLYVAQGSGYVSQSDCNSHQWGAGCYETGSLWYPACPAGYTNHGVLDCSPVCPSGMTDAGADCTKNTTTVGAGTVPGCGSGLDSDAGLCYPKCASGFNGIGPVCWGSCPSDKPYQCGAACATSQAACQNAVGNMVLDTTAVAINILADVFGAGPELKAGEEAEAAGTQAAFDQILTHNSTNWVSMAAGVGKEYALAYGKTFVKTTLKNKLQTTLDERNMFWTFAKDANSGALKALNGGTTELATAQLAPTTSPFQFGTLVQSLDPTGITTLVDTFTQYGSCSGNEDFYTTPNELQFGSTVSGVQMSFTLTAQQPLTVLRMTSPALTRMTITPTSGNCIGKYLSAGQSCTQYVTVTGGTHLDSELRIYTDNYATIPETVHILANTTGAAPTPLFVPDQDAINIASLAGAWNFNGSEIIINSDGTMTGGSVLTIDKANNRSVKITNAIGISTIWYVDEAAENLISFDPSSLDRLTLQLLPNSFYGYALAVLNNVKAAGTQLGVEPSNGSPEQNFTFKQQPDDSFEIIADNGQVLKVKDSSLDDGAAIIQWPDHETTDEHFLVEPLTDGNVKLIGVNSGEAITVGSNSPGSPNAQYFGTAVQTAWSDAQGQEFTLKGVTNTPKILTKLPWGAGCQPGETLYAGLCYPVDLGYRMTTPGVEGQPCPIDWRDDGSTCWPPWTGVEVASQADPNPNPTSLTAYSMRHPLVVTSCSSYAAAKGQACPANFQNIGGVGSCSCQAEGQSKNIKTITGHAPSN